jgi:hypothetical protein
MSFNAVHLGDRGSFDRNSVDRNCVLSVDQNFTNQLTEFLDAFQLIKSFNNDFGQTPKFFLFCLHNKANVIHCSTLGFVTSS